MDESLLLDFSFFPSNLSYIDILKLKKIDLICNSEDISINRVNLDNEIVQKFDILPLNQDGGNYLLNTGLSVKTSEKLSLDPTKYYYCWIFTNSENLYNFINSKNPLQDDINFKLFNMNNWYIIYKRFKPANSTPSQITIIDKITSKNVYNSSIGIQLSDVVITQSDELPYDIRFSNDKYNSISNIVFKDNAEKFLISMVSSESDCYISKNNLFNKDIIVCNDPESVICLNCTDALSESISNATYSFVFKLNIELCDPVSDIVLTSLFNSPIYLKKNGNYIIGTSTNNINYHDNRYEWLFVSIVIENNAGTLIMNGTKVSLGNIYISQNLSYHEDFKNFAGSIAFIRFNSRTLPDYELDEVYQCYHIGEAKYIFEKISSDSYADSNMVILNNFIVSGKDKSISVYKKLGEQIIFLKTYTYSKFNSISNIMKISNNTFAVYDSRVLYIYDITRDGILVEYPSIVDSNKVCDIVSNKTENQFFIKSYGSVAPIYSKYQLSNVDKKYFGDKLRDEAVYNEIVLLYYTQINNGEYFHYAYNTDIAQKESDGNYTLKTFDASATDKADIDRSKVNKGGE